MGVEANEAQYGETFSPEIIRQIQKGMPVPSNGDFPRSTIPLQRSPTPLEQIDTGEGANAWPPIKHTSANGNVHGGKLWKLSTRGRR